MSEQTITDFLESRIAEDEAMARAATDGPWELRGGNEWLFPFGFSIGSDDDIRGVDAEHIARHDPARVLAECAAKRAIIKECRHSTLDDLDSGADDQPAPMWVARALAAVYADHAEFQPEWKL